MADFKTTLERLSRAEIEFDSVARNISKLLSKKPQAAVGIMDQLKQAVTEDVIDAETYARLKALVAGHLEAPVAAGGGDERTVFASEENVDATEIFDLTGGGSSADATQMLDGTAAATPMSGQTAGIDFDLTGDAGSQTSSSWPTGDSQTGGTGTDWSKPEPGLSATRLGPGSVLRGRFQLDEVLGVGGMGSVYLGSDLIKVRAKDRNPRVALKVLNEDFKQHPDSFIALQREASRQQKLAHPNIATVYDFDQTEDGLAFLVMEVLEGEALNDYIKKVVKPKGGLPFEEALPMVQGLGNALVYAHDHNIVHSDFKPGNCFITKDGIMKVLDFGIARAVKAPGAAEGETTIFDPGKLGALTPAYASVEMLEGEEPDTRDDIYALACVAYELLTGKHPFNKIPANKARDNGLVPEPIKTITRRQWRGLERGLAYKREDRSQSTAEFLEEFEGATSAWKNPFIMVPAAVALICLAGFFPAKNYLDEQDTKERIALAQSGDATSIEQVLDNITADNLDDAKRDRILNEAKEQILSYFDTTARQQIDVASGNYNFGGARATLADAKQYSVYADSSKLAELEEYIEDSENRLFAEQLDKFNLALANGSLLAVAGEDDIFDAMAVVRQVDPNHPMLKDRRIPGAFATAINQALENEDYEYADELGQVGVGIMPDSANLKNLGDKIAGARDRAETNLRILRAIAAIQQARESGEGLAAYAGVGAAVAELAAADPGNELLDELRAEIAPAATADVSALEKNRAWGKSALMGGDFNGLLRGLGLHDLNARANVLGEAFDSVVAEDRAAVTSAVAADALEPEAVRALNKLASTAPRSERTRNARSQVAKAFLHDAQKYRVNGDYSAARKALDAARAQQASAEVGALLSAENDRIETEQTLSADQRAALAAERRSSFDAAYPALDAAISALGTERAEYKAAFEKLNELQALAPGDPRLEEARGRLAAAVDRGATSMGEAGNWDDAVAIAREALIDIPRAEALAARLEPLHQARKQALLEQEKQLVADSKQTIEQLLQDPVADRSWRASVRQKMETIAALGEPGDPWLADNGMRIAAIYLERATAMRNEQRLAEGENLLADAERFAPNAPGLAEERLALSAATEAFEREQAEQARLARVEGMKQTFETQARANDVANAAKTLAALREELDGDDDPFVTRDAPRLLAGAYYKLATTRAAAGDFAAALSFAKACTELQQQRSDCKRAEREYAIDGNIQTLNNIFKRGGTFDVSDALLKLSDVQSGDIRRFEDSVANWAPALAGRLERLKESAGTAANPFIEEAQRIFAGNPVIAAIEPVTLTRAPSRYAADVIAAMDKALLGTARDLLKQATETENDHPDIVRLKGAYNARVNKAKNLYETYKKEYGSADYKSALQTMEEALGVWADSSTFKKEHARVVAKLGELERGPDEPGKRIIAAALPPTDPCEAKLAGHGKRKKGTCFYFVSANQRGPLMVVVPAGEGMSGPFAIGKYEITVSDFNRYCSLSDACQPIRDREGRLPVTGISLDQARAYVEWLSERTGQTFRLPTAAEWSYAANAAGAQPKKDYNCRVEQGGQLLKGQGTMGVNTGKANGWGLYNYVGNVQEWVTTGGGVSARGGAYEDTFSKCEIALEKPHDGSPDGATGFRVLLELGAG